MRLLLLLADSHSNSAISSKLLMQWKQEARCFSSGSAAAGRHSSGPQACVLKFKSALEVVSCIGEPPAHQQNVFDSTELAWLSMVALPYVRCKLSLEVLFPMRSVP